MKNKIFICLKKLRLEYVIWICIAIIIFAIMPSAIDYFVFKNDVPSNLNNGEWAGFLGSYIGSIIGGVFTLIGVVMSFKISDKNQIKSEIKENSTIVYYDLSLGILDLKKYYLSYTSQYNKSSVRMYFSKDWIANVAKIHASYRETELMYKVYGYLSEVADLLDQKVSLENQNLGSIVKQKYEKLVIATSELIFSDKFITADKVLYSNASVIELDIKNDLKEEIKEVLMKLSSIVEN